MKLDLRIATRIAGGFGVLLLFIAMLAGSGLLSLRSVESKHDDYASVAANATRVAQIERDIVAVRRALLRFVETADASEWSRVPEMRARLDKRPARFNQG